MMILGEVVGRVVATKKDDNLVGYKLLMIQTVGENNVIVAGDKLGAGVGEYVIVALQYADLMDAVVVGIVDEKPMFKEMK